MTRVVVGGFVAVVVLIVGYAAVLFLTADHGRFRSTPFACGLIGERDTHVFDGTVFRTPDRVGDDSRCEVSEEEDYTAGPGLTLDVHRISDPFTDTPETAARVVRTMAQRSVAVEGLGDQARLVPDLNVLYIRVSNLILTFRPNALLNLRDDTLLFQQLQNLGRTAIDRLPRR